MSTMTGTTLAAEARLRERLAATFATWRVLDQKINDALMDVENGVVPDWWRDLSRCQGRMADELDLLEREWVLRGAGGGLR